MRTIIQTGIVIGVSGLYIAVGGCGSSAPQAGSGGSSGDAPSARRTSDSEVVKSAVSVHWNGSGGVFVGVIESVRKVQVGHPFCQARSTCTLDLNPGSYFLKIEAPGFDQPIAVSAAPGAMNEITPAVGSIALHWNGASGVFVAIMDSTQKIQLGHPFCQAKGTYTQDFSPGDYYLKIEAPGFDQPIALNVAAGGTGEVVPPVGEVSLHWNGANGVFVGVMNSMQNVQLAHPFCQANSTCTLDLNPGKYYLKIEASRFDEPIPLDVGAGQNVEISR